MRPQFNRFTDGQVYGPRFDLTREDEAIVGERVENPRAAQRADTNDAALSHILTASAKHEVSSHARHTRRAFPREEILQRAD
jgi:hypothetical protein